MTNTTHIMYRIFQTYIECHEKITRHFLQITMKKMSFKMDEKEYSDITPENYPVDTPEYRSDSPIEYPDISVKEYRPDSPVVTDIIPQEESDLSSQKLYKLSSENLENTLKSAFSEDKPCDPDIDKCMNGMVNLYKLDKKVGKNQFDMLTSITNSTEQKFTDVMNIAKEYNISADKPEINRFIAEYKEMCAAMRRYTESISSVTDVKQIDRYYRNLKFQSDQLHKAYESATKMFEERKSYEPASGASKVWSLVKWIWNYKYILYITGLLLYNTTIYVFPSPMTMGLDLLVRIAGTICYTFASDRTSVTKLIELVTTMFVMVISGMSELFLPGIFSRIKVPKFLEKIFNIGSSAFFCLFTYYSVDWISYILKIICKGILITGAALRNSTSVLEGVWLGFVEAAEQIKDKLILAAEFIKASLVKGMDIIIDMLSKLFSNLLYDNVLVPAKDYLLSIPQKVISGGSSFLSLMSGLFTEQEKGLVAVQNSELKVAFNAVAGEITKNSQSEIEMAVNSLLAVSDSKFEAVISKDKNVFVQQSVAFMNKNINDIKSITKKALEDAQRKTENIYKSTFDEMGLTSLWNDLEKLEFRSSYFPYMLGIMFVISVFHIMFN